MKPDFALDFRDNQIALLHRQEAGWAIIGRVAMDDPDLDAAMAYLRATALGLSPRGVSAKLILPNEAILYTEVANLPYDPAMRATGIAAALVGRTPYDVADLVYDWTDAGTSAHVAVIARETLEEAEGFASQHRFNPVSFAALPNQGGFDGEVWFGATKLSETLLAGGEVVERDDVTLLAPDAPAPVAVADASDFEMGAGAETDAFDAPHDEVAAKAEPDPAPELAPETDLTSEVQVEVDAEPIPEREDTREVWQDFVADVPEDTEADVDAVSDASATMMQIEAAPEPDHTTEPDPAPEPELPTSNTASQDPPASFEAAMDEVADDVSGAVSDWAEPAAEAQSEAETDVEEAPMAVDVPLIDDLPAVDAALANLPTDAFGEKPQSRAEKMLAAFAARRAAALAKAEAETNTPRMEPVLRAKQDVDAQPSLTPDAPSVASASAADAPALADAPIDLATPDQRDTPAPDAPIAEAPMVEAPMVDAPTLPKLGAADAKLGRAPELSRPSAMTPPVVAHVPAKPQAKKPQDLKSMPKAKGGTSSAMRLGWILTAVLLLSLMAAAALSELLIVSYNALFGGDTAIVSVEPAPSGGDAAAATPIALGAAPTAAPPATDVNLSTRSAAADQASATPATTPATIPATAPEPDALAQTLPPAAVPDLALPALLAPPAPQNDSGDAVASADTAPDISPAAAPIVAPAVAVTSGRPAVVPKPRPDVILAAARSTVPSAAPSGAATADPTVTATFADPALAGAKPLARPASVLAAAAAVAPSLGPPPGADPALADARPAVRPAGILAAGRAARLASAPASIVAGAEAAAAEASLAPTAIDPNRSPLAVSVSRIPAPRPNGLKSAFEQALAAAAAAQDPAPEAAPEAGQEPATEEAVSNAAPADESVEEDVGLEGSAAERSVVAKQATQRNMLNLGNTNLVGIFGSKANRYALIRQPSGSFKKLKVGDRFDGGRIAAITESEVRYEKGGELLALRMPKT